jgi:hypothetical protein
MGLIFGIGKNVSVVQTAQTGSGVHPTSCTVGTRISFFLVLSDRGVKLPTYVHVVLRLRMCGAVPLLPLSAFEV